jgi:hypothetical protein
VKRVVQREVKGDAAKMKGALNEEKRLAAAKVESESEDEASLEQLLPVEDLAALPVKAQSLLEKEEESESAEEAETAAPVPGEEPQMLNPSLRAALSKQGYRLLGSHSGVKLCRWTKSMLRGRGGCYKHTFYGLSCADLSHSSRYLFVPMHGDDALAGLCQQMRLLLAPSLQSRWNALEVASRCAAVPARVSGGATRADGEADARRARREC